MRRLAVPVALLSLMAAPLPVLAHGVLRGRAGSLINLQCKIVETDGDETISSVGGTAFITESEWAMLGRSAAVPPADQTPPPPGGNSSSSEDQVISHLGGPRRPGRPLELCDGVPPHIAAPRVPAPRRGEP